MGIFSFLSGNYKPSDFTNKTLEQIFKEIKLDKVDKSIQEDAEFNALPEETKSAIQMLIDLKEGKNIIYNKCYKGKGASSAPHPHAPAQHAPAQHAPAQHAPAQHAPAKVNSYHATVPAELPTAVPNKPTAPGSLSRGKPLSFGKPVPAPIPVVEKASVNDDEEEEKEEKEEGQTGGGRRGRKSRKGKSRRSTRQNKSRRSNKRKY